MLFDAIDPLPLVTVHCWLAGFATTVTLYAVPAVNEVAKVNAPFAGSTLLSPPLLASVIEPFSPETLPPTEYVVVVGVVGVGGVGCGSFGSPSQGQPLKREANTSGPKSRHTAPKRLVCG
jgi:hypothetical protein